MESHGDETLKLEGEEDELEEEDEMVIHSHIHTTCI